MASASSALPVYFTGNVVHGAGRGGTQLGFPTGACDGELTTWRSLPSHTLTLRDFSKCGPYYDPGTLERSARWCILWLRKGNGR